MKRMFLPLLLILLATGCAGMAPGITPTSSASPENTDEATCVSAPASMVCRIVDGAEEGELLLAELETEGLIPSGSGGVFLLSTEGVEVWLDDRKADASALEDGMAIEVFYRDEFDETLPAPLREVLHVSAWSLGSEKNPGGGYYDLCGFYLQVLDDLWREDIALNTDISAVALDLSEAPGGLSETEKTALAWKFAESHGVELVSSDRETLIAEGYFSKVEVPGYEGETSVYEWTDGCLFSIRAHETEEVEVYSLPVLRFDADKYRGPLAAYCFYDCAALWPQLGSWSEYQVGARFIA